MKVISICSQKGGVSKSTTTIEIGTEFKKRGYSVLVIDFDQQCSLSKNVAADFSKPSIMMFFMLMHLMKTQYSILNFLI